MDALLLSLMLCMLVELRSGAARLYAGLPAGREGALLAMPPLVALPVASFTGWRTLEWLPPGGMLVALALAACGGSSDDPAPAAAPPAAPSVTSGPAAFATSLLPQVPTDGDFLACYRPAASPRWSRWTSWAPAGWPC